MLGNGKGWRADVRSVCGSRVAVLPQGLIWLQKSPKPHREREHHYEVVVLAVARWLLSGGIGTSDRSAASSLSVIGRTVGPRAAPLVRVCALSASRALPLLLPLSPSALSSP